MISKIKGKIWEIAEKHVVVNVNDIGYKVFVTDDTLHSTKLGSDITFWTYLAIRENSQDLYGFMDKKDRDFFELLITVSGVGPKSAMNIMSLISVETLQNAIRTGSTNHLIKVSGIGRKTAEKIVLELKDKLGILENVENNNIKMSMSSDMDVIEALKALGYDTHEAREALKKIDKDITDTSAKIKATLKILS